MTIPQLMAQLNRIFDQEEIKNPLVKNLAMRIEINRAAGPDAQVKVNAQVIDLQKQA